MIKQIVISIALIFCVTAIMPRDRKTLDRIIDKLQEESEADKFDYRLPQNTAPCVYIIEFDPDIDGETFTFKGNSTIIFKVLEPTISVVLHKSNKITIDEDFTELVDENEVSQKPKIQKWNPANEFYTIEFDEELKPGNYTLKMKWSGVDAADDWFIMRMGFFRGYYPLENNTLQYLVSTHFQPAGARSAFPCWDEPGFKAQFEISIKHFPNYTALSNMPVKNHQQLPDGRIITNFERSVKMSSYLPCVAVANYKFIKNAHGNITFYGLESDLESLKFALEISEKVVSEMEKYTGIPYALSKLDQIALPQYTDAMEHWGLISYDLNAINLDNTLAPDVFKSDNAAILVSHETVHQWFGNLVSPVYWDDTWLNEAFADYFQIKMLDQIYPHWRMMDFYIIQNINDNSYSAEATSPIPTPIKWIPRDRISMELMFSSITYFKGGAVILMLEHILTGDVFRDGVQRHLEAHKFSNAVPNDLWSAFQESYDERYGGGKLDVKRTIDPWLQQTGTPIVTVTRNYQTGETNLSQKNSQDLNADNTWRIPINYATKSNPDFSNTAPRMWMEKDEDTIILLDINKDDWIIFNIQQREFYQINYDKENWRRIAEYLSTDNYDKIHPINRAQLIEDAFRMYEDDNTYLDVLINITSYLHQETDYLPWVPASKVISEMFTIMRNTPEEDLFKTYMLFLTSEISNKLNFENQETYDYSAIRIRSRLGPLICEFGHIECRSFSQKLLDKFLENPSTNRLPSTDEKWIICSGLRESNDSTKQTFLTTTFKLASEDMTPITFIIQCTDDMKKRDQQISLLLSNSTTDVEEVDGIFKALIESNRDDVNYILNYFINHFKEIKEFYDEFGDEEYLIPILRMALAVKSEDQYNEYKAFVENLLNDKTLPEEQSRQLSSALEDSSYLVDVAKLTSAKFHEFMDQKLLGPNAIDSSKN